MSVSKTEHEAVKPERYFLGESCFCISLGTEINARTSASVLKLYKEAKKLQSHGGLNVLDIVPSYTSLALYFDPVSVDASGISETIDKVLAGQESGKKPARRSESNRSKKVVLPVRYDGHDIGRVAAHNGLSCEDVIRLHTKGSYKVAMIGFLPHFPYLLGLNKKLATPRLDRPRTHVPAGSVAIGGKQTGVYPCESPGGWNVIGTTEPEMLMSLLPGDSVVFTRV
jgi:KipI family sensor histidine kinase inhibitor